MQYPLSAVPLSIAHPDGSRRQQKRGCLQTLFWMKLPSATYPKKISVIVEEGNRVFIDFNTGQHKKVLCLGDLELTDIEQKKIQTTHSH